MRPTTPKRGHSRQCRRRDDQGSALIIALVFLVVFAMLGGVVASLATVSLRAGDIVGEHSDTLFGADDAAERTQVGIESNLDPACDADGVVKPEPFVHNGSNFFVRCSYLKEGENPLPGVHYAMMLFSKDEWALTKVGGPAASLTGDIRLNTDMPCFRFAPDGMVAGIGLVRCSNPPDERAGLDLLKNPIYSAVGPIRFRADSDGNQGKIDVREDCSKPDWVPAPADMASAVGGAHLQNANHDGSGPYAPFTASNWTCHTDDLVASDPDYPLPKGVTDETLPTQNPAGTYENCSDNRTFNTAPGLFWLFRYDCVRRFKPGRYTSNPILDLTASYGYNGKSTGVRANIFDPGVYWFDTDATTPAQPWFPDPGVNLTVRDQYQDAPIVMGTPDPRITDPANNWWTNTDVVANVPIDQRCTKGQPGVELVFNPGYGMWVNLVNSGIGNPSAQVTACQLRPEQVRPGGEAEGAQPGIVLYQKKYDAALWNTGFTNWPVGNPTPWSQHPAWGTFALFNSADNVSSGGLVMDGFIYAPHGMIKTAIGLAGTGAQIASGIIAFSLQLKAVGAGGQMVANEQPRFSGKYLVEIWNCGASPDPAACGISDTSAPPPDARALVDAADPGGTGPRPIRFDRWLPN